MPMKILDNVGKDASSYYSAIVLGGIVSGGVYTLLIPDKWIAVVIGILTIFALFLKAIITEVAELEEEVAKLKRSKSRKGSKRRGR